MAYDVRFLSEADVAALGISMKEVLDQALLNQKASSQE